jgi:hypothetical protein
MDYEKELRKKLFELVLSGKHTSQYFLRDKFNNDIVLPRIKELREVYKKDSSITNKFESLSIINSIKCDEKYLEESLKESIYKAQRDIEDFIIKVKNPQKGRIDYFALCLGYDGFSEFKKGIADLEGSPEDEKSNVINPMDYEPIKDFFENPNYLYVYDEDLVEEEKETTLKLFHYPNIDALVLSYDSHKEEFTLKNIYTNKEKTKKKKDHKKGEISWCKEKNEGQNDMNSFDIVFKESRTKLILRISFPYEDYEDGKEFNLLLGAFLIARKRGSVAVGTVVIERNLKNETLEPYRYEYKNGSSFNEISSKNSLIPPRDEIQNYLYDRYKNWIKIPYKKQNFKEFEAWVRKKNKKNYAEHGIKMFDYLICHPNSSLTSKAKADLQKKVLDLIDKPRKTIESSKLLTEKDKDILGKYICEKRNSNKIKIYPPTDRDRAHYEQINKDFFLELKKTVNVLIIIPKEGYKDEKISSIYTVIGYCLALKKRTFVFFESKSERPNILQKGEKNVNLHVYDYEYVSKIPEILINNHFKDDWEEMKRNYKLTK